LPPSFEIDIDNHSVHIIASFKKVKKIASGLAAQLEVKVPMLRWYGKKPNRGSIYQPGVGLSADGPTPGGLLKPANPEWVG
jgi:hypothetical protein